MQSPLQFNNKIRSKTQQIASLHSSPLKQPHKHSHSPTYNPQKPLPTHQYQLPTHFECPFSSTMPKQPNSQPPKRCQFKQMKKMMKAELQKLSYSDKLNNISSIITQCKQLAHKYGYFSLTCTMFEYNSNNAIKFSVWIHPNRKVMTPLHPIQKASGFECELEFVRNMKKILKDMFPTVSLGQGKTLANLIYHVENEKKTVAVNKRIHVPMETIQDRLSQSQSSSHYNQNPLYISLKNIPNLNQKLPNQHNNESQSLGSNRNDHKKTRYEPTTSTLLESMQSSNSLKQKLKRRVKEEIKEYEQREYQQRGYQQGGNPTKITHKKQTIEKHIEKSNRQEDTKKSSVSIRKSRINKKMFVSGEIQNQFKDLFDSEQLVSHGYYSHPNADPPKKHVQLSTVTQQFQGLFF